MLHLSHRLMTGLQPLHPHEEDPMNRTRLTRIGVSAAAGLLVAGAVAFAAWSVSGSGTGSATAANAVGVTLTAGSPSGSLYPGATADVATSIDNPNPFPVHVSEIDADTGQGTGGFDVDGGHSGCDLSALSFSPATNGGAGWDIPANSSLDVDADGAVSMSDSAGDACQGATFTVYLTATAASA
jgi:hypothetical protein